MADRPYSGAMRGFITSNIAALVVVLALPQAALAGDPAPSNAELEFVGLLNQERTNQGLSVLEIAPALTAIGDDYVAENVSQGGFSHDRDAPFIARANQAGFAGWSGPALAQGYASPAEVLQGWLGSPGHRAIVMDPANTHVGAGFRGEHAVAFALRDDPGRFGTLGVTRRGRPVMASKRPRAHGRMISTRVRIRAGQGTLRLTARKGRFVVRGRRVSVVKRARSYRLAVKVSRPGRWKVSLVANGRTSRRFTVRVGR
jgi:hypothetical protein